MSDERKPWEQLPEEPDAAYTHFLIYRNLGPARSLDAAYRVFKGATKRGKRLQAPSGWGRESAQYDWVSRAAAWDVDVLVEHGRDTVVAFVESLRAIAFKSLRVLEDERIKPKSWAAALEAVSLLGGFIPSETVQQIQSDAREHRVSAIGSPDHAKDD